MKRFLLLSLAMLLSLAACQSEKAAVEVICNAPNDCVECSKADPAMKMMKLAQHIEDRVSNGKAAELFKALAAADPETKHRMLLQRAKALGLASCPLAEMIKAPERQ